MGENVESEVEGRVTSMRKIEKQRLTFSKLIVAALHKTKDDQIALFTVTFSQKHCDADEKS